MQVAMSAARCTLQGTAWSVPPPPLRHGSHRRRAQPAARVRRSSPAAVRACKLHTATALVEPARTNNFEAFREGNRRYAAGFDRAGDGSKPLPPARRALVLTCMDARIHIERALGADIGDIHVVRNAGGRAAEALRSIAISQQLLGTTEVYVIHHTGCGMLTFSNDDMRGIVRQRLGVDAGGLDFLPFSDLEQSVREDVQLLRDSQLLAPGTTIRGGIYNVQTGFISWLSEFEGCASGRCSV